MGRPRQERAARTREALLRAAAEAFDQHGYAGSSINQILRAAGVTAGALYFHFSSKEELARAVMNAQPDTILPLLASEGMQRLVDITMVWSQQLQVDVLLRAGVRLTGEQESFGMRDANPYREWVRIMEDCLRVARDKGELQPGVEPRELAELVVESCTGMQMYAAVENGRADLPERVVRMWRLVLPGVAVPSVIARTEVSPARVRPLMGAVAADRRADAGPGSPGGADDRGRGD
ncbi:ScbR family autoregulator-binding transcription factor [Streptomyces sp. NPDC006971]|uniref:ScbR family autoregulator-binding transcription factor n=1 Tax=Streptomyces sp. NPDC006971 TaxID=3154784 RepID=UPI00340FB167